MLSELEYWYCVPGVKTSGLPATNASSAAGGSATVSERETAFWNASFWVKSGSPLVCARSWRSVTECQATGWLGRRWPIVSSSESFPASTRDSATAPLNALATLAIRM
jgi:hypothetical protein